MLVGDSTWDYHNNKKYEGSGYAIAIFTCNDKDRVLLKIIRAKRFFNDYYYLGYYKGNWELTVIVDDLDYAHKLGIFYEQESIWDFKNNKEIKVNYNI